MKLLPRSIVLVTALSFLLAACSSTQSSSGAATQSPLAPSDVQVSIQDFAYQPAKLTIPVGTRVIWTNNDSVTHTVTSDDGSWDSGPLNKGDTFEHTFDQPGSFNYHCSIHTYMKGVVTVTQ